MRRRCPVYRSRNSGEPGSRSNTRRTASGIVTGAAAGRAARFEEIGPEEAREEMLKRPYMREGLADVLLRLRAHAVAHPAAARPGRIPRELDPRLPHRGLG